MTERDYESGYDLGTDDLPEPRYPDPSPAPAVGELTRIGLKKDGVFHCSCGASYDFSDTAARISQLEAALEAALPYVEAANRAEHLMDGFGPRSRQSSDDHVAAIRAIINESGDF
jgi:hypothetical protein